MKINVTAPINSLGYGIVGLNTVLALERLGHEPALWPIGHSSEAPPEHVPTLNTCFGRQHHYDRNAPSLRIWHQFDLAQHVGKGAHCALPIFELDRFLPNELHHLKQQDVVFAPSHWAGLVLVDNGVQDEKIFYAPFGVDHDIFKPDEYDLQPAHEKTKSNNPTVFLNMGKWEVRKGHDVLIEAFEKAFQPSDNVLLVMHCHNPCFADPERGRAYNEGWNRRYRNSRMGDKVRLTNGRFASQRDVASLMSQADCGVFPARAEGWNLEAAEMLAMGKRVILTNYAAHTEFANPENSRLIEVVGKEEAHDGVWFHADAPDWGGRIGLWASLGKYEVDQLVEHMRAVHKEKQGWGTFPANTAGVETMKSFTWENTAREILAVLE